MGWSSGIMCLFGMISFESINKTYSEGEEYAYRALQEVSFQIEAGEAVALIGPSGCGKSTILNIMGLLDAPSSGNYCLRGQSVSGLDADALACLRNEMIGFVFQSFHLLPRLNAWQNVGLPLVYRGVPAAEIKRCALEVLSELGMEPYAAHLPSELSGGQQQRVALARAVVGSAPIILADEPTGALDSQTGLMVMDLLMDLNRRRSVTMVIVTHDPQVAGQCHRTLRVRDGRITE